MAAEQALTLLRFRLCNPTYVHAAFKDSEQSNYSKLKFIISSSIADACNNSVLLLGPRGSGKAAVVDLVLDDLKTQYPDSICVIRLSGLLHSDDNSALKEIARQLCLEHQLLFSKMASSDDNNQFMIDMLRECGLAHKSIIFVLDEFDLFAQGKQRLLYSLLDALQNLTSQAVVIGVSCRLDADQLLEKRVRSRFSHRKLLFLPPSREDTERLLDHIMYLPKDSGLPSKYITEYNSRVQNILNDKKFKELLDSIVYVDGTINNLVQFLFRAVSFINLESGFPSLENFKNAQMCYQRQLKTENLQEKLNNKNYASWGNAVKAWFIGQGKLQQLVKKAIENTQAGKMHGKRLILNCLPYSGLMQASNLVSFNASSPAMSLTRTSTRPLHWRYSSRVQPSLMCNSGSLYIDSSNLIEQNPTNSARHYSV